MDWSDSIIRFKTYMQIERSMPVNTVNSYVLDVTKLSNYYSLENNIILPEALTLKNLRDFIREIAKLGISGSSQARMISGIRFFFNYLLLENKIEKDPTEFLEKPRIGSKLPEVLTIFEVFQILSSIKSTDNNVERNRAILETLCGCGIRVSELTGLKLTDLYFEEGYVKITGKGDKQRLIPINQNAITQIENYIRLEREKLNIHENCVNILFLNQRGYSLTRSMILQIVKDVTAKAGICKVVSPHTFRHSFATHLIENGCDIRAVQEMLGHSSILTTEIYTHLDRNFIRVNILKYHPRKSFR